jgi:hypothetical protein
VKLPEGEDINEWLAVNGWLPTCRHLRDVADEFYSGGLLQPDQSAIRINYRVLLAADMP